MANSHITYWDDLVQGSEAWRRARDAMFTGSNAYKLLTTFGAGSHAFAEDTNFNGNFHTKRGHILEDEALELYESITGIRVYHTGFVTNSKYAQCLYSPDGFSIDRIQEVKCFGPEKHLKLVDKGLTLEVLAQSHFGQLILEKKLTDLILYCPKPKDYDEAVLGPWPVPVEKMLVIIPIKYDRDIQANFKRIIKEYHGRTQR